MRWFRTFECVWVRGDLADFNGPQLKSLYSDLSELFVDVLRVSGQDFIHVFEHLVAIRKTKIILATSRAKDILQSLNDLMPPLPVPAVPSSSNDASSADATAEQIADSRLVALGNELRQCPIFPIRMQDGSERLLTASDDFAIPDDNTCKELLRGKMDMLNFDVDVVRRLGPLLQIAGLTDRYLSQSSAAARAASRYGIYAVDMHLSFHIYRKASIWTR